MDIVDAARIKKPEGYLDHYSIGLLFAQAPRVEASLVGRSLATTTRQLGAGESASPRVGVLQASPSESEENPVLVEFHRLGQDDQTDRHASTAPWRLSSLELSALTAELLDPAIEQSWWWPAGRSALGRANHLLELRDEGCDPECSMAWRERISCTQEILAAVLEATEETPCIALHWLPTQQLIDPIEARATWIADGFTNPLPGAINVRFYRAESTDRSTPGEADYLMDTLGLSAVGLRDLQCHFRGIDPDEVGSTLYNAALYQWDRGPVFSDGHSVEGPRDKDEWLCQTTTSKADPRRDIVDLDPGFPFSAR